jgi:hypothetical protein
VQTVAGVSATVRDISNMLASMGIFVDKASDKSFKMLGVTMTQESGTALENVRDQGRWKTPLHYKVNSVNFKKHVASQVPVRNIPNCDGCKLNFQPRLSVNWWSRTV